MFKFIICLFQNAIILVKLAIKNQTFVCHVKFHKKELFRITVVHVYKIILRLIIKNVIRLLEKITPIIN